MFSRSSPPLWLYAALWLTTRPARTGRIAGLPESWAIRIAAPKWACVWGGHPGAQSRLRRIVMPAPSRGPDDPAWRALLRQRMGKAGLSVAAPDPRLLAQAEGECFARLAPPWTRRMTGPSR